MFRKIVMLLCLMFGSSAPLLATCQGYLFADDWADDLSSVNDVRDYCNKRLSWWSIDSKYFDQSCFAQKYSKKDDYGRDYDRYSVSFFWKLGNHKGQYASDVYSSISKFLQPRSFQGWPLSVKILLDPKCSDTGPY